ncbi:MAG: energy-coupling factor ABC transporter permease, partial [Syntrophobacteraceae bacterium]
MHIEDGILPPKAWGMWYAVSAVFVYAGVVEIKRRVK